MVPAALATELIGISEGLRLAGRTPADCVDLLRGVTDSLASQRPVVALKQSLRDAGIDWEGDAFERMLLYHALEDSAPRIDALPVHPAVKLLIRKEFQRFASAPGSATRSVLVETDPFVAASKICTLRRFPSGPLDWVVSGMPRSWLLNIPPRESFFALRFIFLEFGGLKPAFYVHVAHPPRNRALIIEKEVRRSYYRMACSLAMQPGIKGIMCASWFHDPAALEDYPHLAAVNEPYLNLGGRIVTTLGPAPVESGFLKHNAERRERYQRGEWKPRTALAMWPREAALAWMRAHPELEA